MHTHARTHARMHTHTHTHTHKEEQGSIREYCDQVYIIGYTRALIGQKKNQSMPSSKDSHEIYKHFSKYYLVIYTLQTYFMLYVA